MGNKATEVVILSGKGGTGKTSLCAAFAHLSQPVVIADCDVDAANLHLLLQPTEVERTPFLSGYEAKIRPDDCTMCALCWRLCRFDAISRGENSFVVDPIRCEGCGLCYDACPERAIDLTEAECGTWSWGETAVGPMVSAALYPAAENSGRLVTQVRQKALALSKEFDCDLLLIDGPPGISCPTIASVTGVDLALLVAEPSLSALHDLERVGALCDSLSLPVAVCINKFDLDGESAEKIIVACEKAAWNYVGAVAYDPQMIAAQIAAINPLEMVNSETRNQITTIWERVCKMM